MRAGAGSSTHRGSCLERAYLAGCRRRCALAAGQRRRSEESFQAAKGLTGLDQHQVRRWTSWHRWTTPGQARPRLPRRGHRRPTRPPPGATGPDRADRQRVPPPLRRRAPRHPPHHLHVAGLVGLAPTTPSPSPRRPLQTPRSRPAPMITIYGCCGWRPEPTQVTPARRKRPRCRLYLAIWRLRSAWHNCPIIIFVARLYFCAGVNDKMAAVRPVNGFIVAFISPPARSRPENVPRPTASTTTNPSPTCALMSVIAKSGIASRQCL